MGRKKLILKEKPKSHLTADHIKLLQIADKVILHSTAALTPSISKNLELQEEINELMDQVQLLEKDMEFSYSYENRSNSNTIKKFTDWLSDNGAKFQNIEIVEYPEYGLGLETSVNVEQSNLIMSIPQELMLTLESAKNSSLGPLIELDPLLNNMHNVTLAVFLLLEKFKGDSFWKPYIDVLPQTYSTVLYFNIEELRQLQASPTLTVALRQIRNIARQYAYFYKLIWSLENPVCKLLRKHFTFKQYRWAVSTVMTRQNNVPCNNGNQMINALIPLWDFCNHTSGKVTTTYNIESKCCDCFAVKDFKAGEQIFIFYGDRSNPELFIHNGFIYEDNQHDRYGVKLGISKSDILKEDRIKLLNLLSIPENGEFCLKAGSKPISGQLLAFLRIFNMNAEQLNEWKEKDNLNSLQDLEVALDSEFENKYWNFAIARIKLILSTYKTTLQHDLDLIQDCTLSPNSMLACKMRISEKKLLENAIKHIQLYLK